MLLMKFTACGHGKLLMTHALYSVAVVIYNRQERIRTGDLSTSV